jgi:hypothetical protein
MSKPLVILLLVLLNAYSLDILYSDDFSSDNLEDKWIFYGDPQSIIVDSLGSPPPCFLNNGDTMWGSGVISRDTFNIDSGLVAECDIFMDCSERGAWVSAQLRLVTTGYRNETTEADFALVTTSISYMGELNWNRPHLETVLLFIQHDSSGSVYRQELLHQNHLLSGWHNFRLIIDEERVTSLYIDDSLIITSPEPIPGSIHGVRVQLGDRSSDWGIALHDNLRVYRP